MSVWSDLVKGGLEGLLGSAGSFAKDLRGAITGKSILDAKDVAEIQKLTLQFENELDARKAALENTIITAEKEITLAQIDVNREDAKSGSLFRGGWRPAVGWICASALGYHMIARPLLPWVVGLFHTSVAPMPGLELDTLMTLLGGLLGLGGFRTFEKVKGIK